MTEAAGWVAIALSFFVGVSIASALGTLVLLVTVRKHQDIRTRQHDGDKDVVATYAEATSSEKRAADGEQFRKQLLEYLDTHHSDFLKEAQAMRNASAHAEVRKNIRQTRVSDEEVTALAKDQEEINRRFREIVAYDGGKV